jgi:hypothetical protein
MSVRDLDFQFMVFQGNPKQDSVYYFLDGEKVRRSIKHDQFIELVRLKAPQLVGEAHNHAITYSFFLWSIPDAKIVHLSPLTQNMIYPDNRTAVILGKKTGKIPTLIKQKKTIQEMLMGYGFSFPTDMSIQNLQTSLEKRNMEQEGFLARFLNRRRNLN